MLDVAASELRTGEHPINLQTIDVLDDALRIYERVFSQYER
jgi:hypothetical protein